MGRRAAFILAVISCAIFFIPATGWASAYNGQPKLVVVIIIDQFRGDYLDRGRDQFGPNGFRLLMDRGAWFSDCNYQYANTRTAPGHATLFTGTYSNGHGILNNEWYDATKKKMITAVDDDSTRLVGLDGNYPGFSPHNLLADTLGDELRMATDGKSRVFAISLKERSSILPAGYSGTAFWPYKYSGQWITSTYYMKDLPDWVKSYNKTNPAEKYWNRDWKVGDKLLRRTSKPAELRGEDSFYEIVGSTPYANDFELDFARELVTQEKLGEGPATDLLLISLSAPDILGHKVGPNTDESRAMVQAIDRQLAGFFEFLGNRLGLGNLWIALSADHGVSTAPSFTKTIGVPSGYLVDEKIRSAINTQLSAKYGKAEYVPQTEWPLVFLNPDAFTAAKLNEDDAERQVADILTQFGSRGYVGRSQIARHDLPPTPLGKKFANSYAPQGGWYLYAFSPPFTVTRKSGTGTDHAMPYSYDTHVPLMFFGLPFQPGTYRGRCEPVDMAVTLANLLGINSPSAAVGRVLTEALAKPASESKR
ncbi:MAG TPA: alkaline phosphatase family protein [Terriglobales bacterium]|nr:alkaline phosphatase family protein [Terriglobales bacterium]